MQLIRRHIVLFLLILVVPQGQVLAESDPKETLLAAISYNLARFVTQVSDGAARPEGPLVFCVLRQNPISDELSMMQAARSGRQSVLLRKLDDYREFYQGCDISFISKLDMVSVSPKRLAEAGNVTISDADEFLNAGGGIQLVQVGQKFAFSVNMEVFQLAHKALPSRVLKLAQNVRPAP